MLSSTQVLVDAHSFDCYLSLSEYQSMGEKQEDGRIHTKNSEKYADPAEDAALANLEREKRKARCKNNRNEKEAESESSSFCRAHGTNPNITEIALPVCGSRLDQGFHPVIPIATQADMEVIDRCAEARRTHQRTPVRILNHGRHWEML